MPQGYGLSAPGVTFKPLPFAWVEERMAASRNYWVATTRHDGRPHVIPVWGLWLDGAFFFSTDPDSLKGRNIARDPRVVVHLESGDEVVVMEGDLVREHDAGALSRFSEAYDAKYRVRPDVSDPDAGPVYRLKHHTALAWLEKDFPSTATRWQFA